VSAASRAVALVYDVTESASLTNLARWCEEIGKAVSRSKYVVVGNKTDLPRNVPPDAARRFADEIGAPYVETSAATGEGVPEMFAALAQQAS
jgi:GTPase SAR1 family protein